MLVVSRLTWSRETQRDAGWTAVEKQLVELGGEPVIGTPEAFGALIVTETEKWKKVIEGADIQKVE